MQADFAKMGGGRRGTMVGTINYVSPEMIKDQIAIPASDLWAFGCIIFKMHTGKVPFPGTVPQTVYQKIVNREIDWPVDLDEDARDIVEKILHLDPAKRLGAEGTNHDIKAMYAHPYFKGINMSSDLSVNLNMEKLLRDSESPELKA